MLLKSKKRIALFTAVVMILTTAFSLPVLAEEQPDSVETTEQMAEAEPASATDAEMVQETEETEADTEENVQEAQFVVFDHIYNENVPLYRNFSSCELLVKADPSVFTRNTEVVSVLDGVYMLRFSSEEETRNAYTYYYDKVQSIDVNVSAFTISSGDTEAPVTETPVTETPEQGITEVPVPDVADLSEVNTGEDAFSQVTELPDTSMHGTIALIDTGCSGKNVRKAVSVIGENAADDNGHGTAMYNAITAEYPDAQILSIKALGADGTAQISDIYAAIRYAIDSDVKIINLSIAARKTAASGLIDEIIKEATDKGIIVVGAAGNQGRRAALYVPGGLPEVVTAGACDSKGKRLEKSNYGDTVDYNVFASSTSEAAAILSAMIDRDGIEKLPVNQGKIFATDYVVPQTTEAEVTTEAITEATELEPEKTTEAGVTTETTEATTEAEVSTGTTEAITEATELDTEKPGKWNISDLIDSIFYMQTGSCAGYVSQRLGLPYMSRILYLYPYLLEHGWRVVGRGGPYVTSVQRGCSDLSAEVNRVARPGDIIVFYSSPNWGNNDDQTHVGIINKTGGAGEYESGTSLYTYPSYDYDSTDNKGARTNYSIARWAYYAKSDGKSSNSFEILSKVTVEEKGELKLQKSSSMPEVTNGNGCYSLEGAVYNVYSGSTASGTPVATLTTDATGAATISNLNVGTYTLKEVKAPAGYALDTTEYHVTTKKSVVTRVDVTDRPLMDPATILLKKQNTNGLPIAGAQYTVKYYKSVKMNTDPAAAGVPLDRTWAFKTDENGAINFSNDQKWFVSGDAFYLNAFNAAALPEGTVTIQETSAPAGYVLDPTIYTRQITPDANNDIGVSTFNAPTITEQTVRGDMAFTKKTEDGEPLANVKFSLTCNDTGESHIIWTDENGYFSTASSYIPHSKDTNSEAAGSGIWFGNETLDDNRGALPYCTYTLKELRCDANKNKYKNIQPITFSITSNNQVYSLADVINYKFPLISTNVIDNETGTNVAALGDTFAGVDIVHLDKLEIGHKYKLTMKAHSKAKGEDLAVIEKKFEATATRMDVNVDVNIDVTDDLRGTDVVIFEYLVDEAYPDEMIAFEEDLGNADQTVHFPKIGTTFTDNATGDHVAYPDKKVKHTDEVAYTNLLVGKTYKTVATLKYKDSGEPVVDADGNEITKEVEFTPEEPDGTVDVVFEFDASLLAGKSIVAFEKVYYEGKEVAAHEDLTDEGQTIRYPKIGTTFTDNATGDHVAYPDKKVKHTDEVAYTNLLVGKTYKAVATLKFKDSGETVVDADGNEITQEVEFIPETADGTVDVVFEFDASLLAGKSIVAFEKVYYEGKEVAAHEDLTDEGQTIRYPKIGTTFTDNMTGDHVASPDKQVKHTDVVAYTNLLVGKTYKTVATLKYKDSGEPVKDADGKEITEEVEFTPGTPDGTVDVVFEFDASLLAGRSIVAFEKVYYEDKEVAAHEDLTDEGQTIRYPKIGTTFTDNATGNHVAFPDKKVKHTDVVAYTNLLVGKTYKTVATLKYKDSGEPVVDADGKEITEEVEFTPETPDGTVDVVFEFDASLLAGRSIVAFEKVYYEDKEVAAHEDLTDEGQTITYPPKPPKVTPPVKTGDSAKLLIPIAAGIAAAAGIVVMVYKRKKKK